MLLSLAAAALIVSPSFSGARIDESRPSSFLGVDVEQVAIAPADIVRHDFLENVREELRTSPTRIAANTLRAIDEGLVELDTLDRLTPRDCHRLFEENAAAWKDVDAQSACQGVLPDEVFRRVSGFQNENRIYVSMLRTPREAASTAVHETNHVANRSHDHYATPDDILREEYRAYLVAQRFEDSGRVAGGAWKGWLRRWIASEYSLAADVNSVAEEPQGNLDNDFGFSRLSAR